MKISKKNEMYFWAVLIALAIAIWVAVWEG